jgi:hypothetical protein
MPEIIDDKSEHCVPFILDRITKHRESYASKGEEPTPFFVGLNGVQGAGKTTLVCHCPMITISNAIVALPARSYCFLLNKEQSRCLFMFLPRSTAETR